MRLRKVKKETLGMSKFLDFSTLIHFVDNFDAEWEVVGNMYDNKKLIKGNI